MGGFFITHYCRGNRPARGIPTGRDWRRISAPTLTAQTANTMNKLGVFEHWRYLRWCGNRTRQADFLLYAYGRHGPEIPRMTIKGEIPDGGCMICIQRDPVGQLLRSAGM
jgi:hypothetical protein